jgi:5,10-methylenetetrahydromethanopterin reductase
MSKVPVIVAASGPRIIHLAAAVGDGILLAVGADPARVGWAVETARSARAELGLPLEGFRVAALVPMLPWHDPREARLILGGITATMARFSSMHGRPHMPIPSADKAIYEDISRRYTTEGHAKAKSPQASALTDDFIGRFGIVGSDSECIRRLKMLQEIGIDTFVIATPIHELSQTQLRGIRRQFAERILPAMR